EQMREFHRNLIEASLYAAGRPLTIEEISNKLEFPKKEVEELINEVAFDYLDRSTALVIAQIGDRYQMQIRPEYTEKVSKFAKGGAIAERYLRTLTIIALKQPILKSTVIKFRGTGAYEHVKYLIDNGFINAIKKGRTHELTTTDKYADMFGLPKDKFQLKQAMITQLGIEESSIEEQSSEIEESMTGEQLKEPEDTSISETPGENIDDLATGTQMEIEEEKEEE
ncbi:MAG: SMC-Scp complex subunit ScpB, partial [Promethearchaeota archaeon]